jgi:hypothetical protein
LTSWPWCDLLGLLHEHNCISNRRWILARSLQNFSLLKGPIYYILEDSKNASSCEHGETASQVLDNRKTLERV